MTLRRRTLKGILILVSAITMAGCSGDKSNQVVEVNPDPNLRKEVVKPQPKPQPKLQPKSQPKSQSRAKVRSKINCLPVSSLSCWIWNSFG